MEQREEAARWEPSYPYWALSIFLSTLFGVVMATGVSGWISSAAAGWGMHLIFDLFAAEGATGPGLILGLAMTIILFSVPPGLLSLFLIALTDLRLRYHPLIGGAFFGASGGWITQSMVGGLFGLVFGFASSAWSAFMLALARQLHDRRVGDHNAR